MMRVFVAGATGAIGKQLVPRLVAAGHEVVGMTRSESKRALLRELGAEPVVADALDPDQVAEAVARARPEVIVHQLTAIGSLDPRHFDRDFALTNRLRTEGTDYLLTAGQAVRVRRFVGESYGGGWYVRTGGTVESEEGPLGPARAREMRETQAAMRYLGQAVLRAGLAVGFMGRLFAGEAGVVMMTEARGGSNAKAKRELAWRPAHPSWRQGFVEGLREASSTTEVTARA